MHEHFEELQEQYLAKCPPGAAAAAAVAAAAEGTPAVPRPRKRGRGDALGSAVDAGSSMQAFSAEIENTRAPLPPCLDVLWAV